VARKRPNASVDQIEHRTRHARTRVSANGLTRAEARALSRSAPLTMAELNAHRLLVDQRIAPLRAVLDGPALERPAVDGPAVDSSKA
jgi:hypothetical protein